MYTTTSKRVEKGGIQENSEMKAIQELPGYKEKSNNNCKISLPAPVLPCSAFQSIIQYQFLNSELFFTHCVVTSSCRDSTDMGIIRPQGSLPNLHKFRGEKNQQRNNGGAPILCHKNIAIHVCRQFNPIPTKQVSSRDILSQ